jgi:hypothetical protein
MEHVAQAWGGRPGWRRSDGAACAPQRQRTGHLREDHLDLIAGAWEGPSADQARGGEAKALEWGDDEGGAADDWMYGFV